MGLGLLADRALAVMNRSLFHDTESPEGTMLHRVMHTEPHPRRTGGASSRLEDKQANDKPIVPMKKSPKLFFYDD